MCPENQIGYIIGLSKHHTTRIHHSFALNQAKHQESSKNKYEQQTLKLDFSQLKQPINTIQSLMKPANKDL